MKREDISDLAVFLVVAQQSSFTAAAAQLGLSQSGISHSIRRLEARLGIRLLARTTRSIAPTAAGEKLLEVLAPAFESVDDRMTELLELKDKPAGTIRISLTEHAAETIVWPAVSRLTAAYPDINVELNISNGLVDIVAERFDAGVRLGERVEKDMIAVRIGPKLRMIAFASPDYLARYGVPETPADLTRHRCINMRFVASGGVYAWEFEKDGREIKTRVEGQLTVNNSSLALKAALAGHGIGFLVESAVSSYLEAGSLVQVLDDWCQPFDGYHLYFPAHRAASPAMRLLIDALKYRSPSA
ncbi:LysR family transcriptional regulator [Rhizobium sp. 2MFCol3.1]|uniref:LysR family transcriptional regulator n=1 Tax=Rhizobium sp. 2MFCol3.1 TaxID=1246459 RepID=UPI00036EECD7|nr:LysR family transcriptional regulator [Rhizobium sp. 2MFCol3.1]